ncbi:helix-turn-helix domain-containing protein [Bacillus salitolerans]|uniref:Helix-turn-helix domain-containing protein n=1 Tax=Bacillus salitolerans TaxID=1437434 RepID=A0ABW4LP71_9BACI
MLEWDVKRVGREIKRLRLQAGLSQKELSNGTVTQARISKIEAGKDNISPLAVTLFEISEILGVSIDHFYRVGAHTEIDHADTVKKQIRKFIRQENYDIAYGIIKKEKRNPVFFKNKRNWQFLLWQEGIVIFYLNKSLHDSLHKLEEALDYMNRSPKIFSEREIEILNSIGIIYFDSNNQDRAITTYNHALNKLSKIPSIQDPTIEARLTYNLSMSLTRKKNFHKSIELCKNGIKKMIVNHKLSLLGKLHYQIGYNYRLLKDYSQSKMYYLKAKFIFELEGDTGSLAKVNEKITEIDFLERQK